MFEKVLEDSQMRYTVSKGQDTKPWCEPKKNRLGLFSMTGTNSWPFWPYGHPFAFFSKYKQHIFI